MPRACSVCTDSSHEAIDRALVSDTPYRRIAAQYAVSEQAIRRHRAEHLPEKLAKAERASEVAEATDLLKEVRALRSKAYAILMRAEREGDLRTALMGIREARACLELLGELQGELDRRATVNVLLAPEWVAVRDAVLSALAPFPDARAAVALSLSRVEASNGHR